MEFLAFVPKMERIQEIARRVNRTGDPVLIVGEVGVGKEHLARWMASLGHDPTWIRVDGQQTTHEELQQLFERWPLRGTIFFHRVDEIPPPLHPWVFRALDMPGVRVMASAMPVFLRVGQDTTERQIFYRFVHTIEIPPLRERVEEIPHFIAYFLEKWGKTNVEVSPDVIQLFQRYPWPGNLLELRNILYQVVHAHPHCTHILPEHLPRWFLRRYPEGV